MGYETTLIFVNNYGRTHDCWNIIATLDLCKVGYDGAMRDLMDTIRDKISKDKKTEYESKIAEMNKKYKAIFDGYGDYWDAIDGLGEDVRNKLYEEYYKLYKELSNVLPYVYYHSQNEKAFEDRYGDILMVTTLNEVQTAIETVNKTESYRRFEIALKMIEGFQEHYNENVSVILWGH